MSNIMYKIIELAINEAEFNGMKYMANKIGDEEYESKREELINRLYTEISQQEPIREEQVV